MDTPKIAFIGAGNMASSIISGLLDSGHPAESISAADPFPASLERLRELGPVAVYNDNAEAVATADVIVLAVKPQIIAEAASSIAKTVDANGPVVISIAAGVTITSMQAKLGPMAAIVRAMPNTPALLRCGATGLFANAESTSQQRDSAQTILEAVGMTFWVKAEQELDAVTALSGSGPAYFFLFMEAMVDAGEKLGLYREDATNLALETSLGASRMAIEHQDVGLAELRRRVTSPGGTTESAIASFEQDKLEDVVARAMIAAADRAAEIAREMG
ncbi:MAG: pyrroline-5-carboxylate reductase [Halioglobus sp.]|nr:pyrroline-5-carboxylate reductase [Halioglobus sp.]